MNFFKLISSDPVGAIVFLLAMILAITVHEFSHAWTADRLGDDTPALMGRVTLNPLAHLDPIGSIMFILFGFGYGRPVIYNAMRLSRKVDELLIALAGPISNLLLAIGLNALALLLGKLGFPETTGAFLQLAALINVYLAAFNMVPIPPLDGSAIVAYFWPEYRSLAGSQIGLIILLAVVFTGALGVVLNPVIAGFSHVATLFGLL